MVPGEDESNWFAQVLFLFHLILSSTSSDTNEFSFVHYFEVTSPIDPVDKALQYLVLRRATEGEVDPSIEFESENVLTIAVVECHSLVPFDLILSVHRTVAANSCVVLLTPEVPWPAHCYYVNIFYQYGK